METRTLRASNGTVLVLDKIKRISIIEENDNSSYVLVDTGTSHSTCIFEGTQSQCEDVEKQLLRLMGAVETHVDELGTWSIPKPYPKPGRRILEEAANNENWSKSDLLDKLHEANAASQELRNTIDSRDVTIGDLKTQIEVLENTKEDLLERNRVLRKEGYESDKKYDKLLKKFESLNMQIRNMLQDVYDSAKGGTDEGVETE